jgi:hypothetical protein
MSVLEVVKDINHLDFEPEYAHMWWYNGLVVESDFSMCGQPRENHGHKTYDCHSDKIIPREAVICPDCGHAICPDCLAIAELKYELLLR